MDESQKNSGDEEKMEREPKEFPGEEKRRKAKEEGEQIARGEERHKDPCCHETMEVSTSTPQVLRTGKAKSYTQAGHLGWE